MFFFPLWIRSILWSNISSYSTKAEIISASEKSISLAQSPLCLCWCQHFEAASYSHNVLQKTVGLQRQHQRQHQWQRSFFPKWQSKYISSSLPPSSEILISVGSKLAGGPLIKRAFMWYLYSKRWRWIPQTRGRQRTRRVAAPRRTTTYFKHRFYDIISERIDVCSPRKGPPWRCPRGPCCSPRSPEPGCSKRPTCPTRKGCTFRSGSTPARLPPRGFHPCWSHAAPAREVERVWGLPRVIVLPCDSTQCGDVLMSYALRWRERWG